MSYLMKKAGLGSKMLSYIPGTAASGMRKAIQSENKRVARSKAINSIPGRIANRVREAGNKLRIGAARAAGDAKVTSQLASQGNKGIKTIGDKSQMAIRGKKHQKGATVSTRQVGNGPVRKKSVSLGSPAREFKAKPQGQQATQQAKSQSGGFKAPASALPANAQVKSPAAARSASLGQAAKGAKIGGTSAKLREKFESQ